jgi:Acylphosphatase
VRAIQCIPGLFSLADYYTEVATRYRITLEGVVQGVGFRPFVKRLADRVALRNGRRGQAAEVSFHISERGCRDSHQDGSGPGGRVFIRHGPPEHPVRAARHQGVRGFGQNRRGSCRTDRLVLRAELKPRAELPKNHDSCILFVAPR